MGGPISTDQSKNTPQQEHKIMGTIWGVPLKRPTNTDIVAATIYAIIQGAVCFYLVRIIVPTDIRLLYPWLQYYYALGTTLLATTAFLFDIYPFDIYPTNGWKHSRLWITAIIIAFIITTILTIMGLLPANPPLHKP
jgi:hypothetical protein